jgi:tellurite methyltransferase
MREPGSQDNRSPGELLRLFPLEGLSGAFEKGSKSRPPWFVSEYPIPPGTPRLIDLRPLSRFRNGHIPGSCHLSVDEIDHRFVLPSRERPLILLSDSVEHCADAARRLHRLGYTAQPVDSPISLWPGPWESGDEQIPIWEPSTLVATWASRLPEGPALDLACGSGRDAVFLARRGADVTGIDLLPDALEQARRLAARHRVDVRFLQADIEKDPSSWDARWGTMNIQRFLHRGVFPLIKDRLLPGGLLLCETFLERQAVTRRKPHSPAHLLKPGELYAAATGLVVLAYHEGLNDRGDWMASLVARKGGDHD